jgi:hypothetical protein
MRVAEQHVLGKFESKMGVQAFDGSITPSLMPYAAGVEVNALFHPSLVPGTLGSLSHTSVVSGFNDFKLKLRPHGRLGKEMGNAFDVASCLGG